MVFPRSPLTEGVIPTMFPQFFSCARVLPIAFPKFSPCTRVLPIVFPKSFPCRTGVLRRTSFTPCCPSCAHAKASFPQTGSSVYLTLPQLLGGGGGGVSCGGSEGFDGVICISHLFQEHVSVDTRFRKVKLHQVPSRLT